MPLNYIYKISCGDDTIKDAYIGSTNYIKRRTMQHKSTFYNENTKKYNCRLYKFIRANGGWSNWKVTALEEFQCDNRMKKTRKERTYIEQLQPTLNTNIPAHHQTGDTWDSTAYKKEYNKTYMKTYQESRKHEKQLYNAEHQKKYIHCDCCKQMIKLASRCRHYKTRKHMENAAIRDTIDEMYKMHDANLLVLERTYNILRKLGNLLNTDY